MTQQDIEQFVASLGPVDREEKDGYVFFFVGEPHLIPFVSIAYADNPHDNASNLDREGVFRVNIGVSKATFDELAPPSAGTPDYAALDIVMPHPDYAAYSYVCILNPSEQNETLVKRLITEAYTLVKERQDARQT